ncbi:glutamate mutase L [Intrasporangium sp. DVR]|uniref:glutamate mutase L n=1 Tax=Intrasporangium sp. DVR TaxID=3127867 RepID=UPI00313A6FDD
MAILTVDFGSTFTKAALFAGDGTLLGTAATPTTGPQTGDPRSDILDGYRALRGVLDAPEDARVHACSSAGGGLRLAVVGYERTVTAEAGHRVGLSAGAKVVHVASGPLRVAGVAGVAGVRRARPDIVLLVGGTDGGNADVLLHNATRLAKAAIGGHGGHAVPIVLAGNREVRAQATAVLESAGRPVIHADNVLPDIGVIAPESARAAIREAFLRHVIGGKGLSRDEAFGQLVEAATPDAVLRGVEVVADARADGDVLVVDIGGATTDVYSVITPEGEDATLHKDVVAPLWHARTVEGDLGMRWNAEHVIEAAEAEHLLGGVVDAESLRAYAAHVHARPGSLPRDDVERRLDLELARLAALVAVRRHARPAQPTESPRPLANVTTLIGSGGVLRHTDDGGRDLVLDAVLADHAGGWKVPRSARALVDTAYLLFAVGLLDAHDPALARTVAAQLA